METTLSSAALRELIPFFLLIMLPLIWLFGRAVIAWAFQGDGQRSERSDD